MVKFRFFVHCEGWQNGGYENAHFAANEKQARAIVDKWNEEKPGSVTLLKIERITLDEYCNDYIGA